MNPNFRVIYRQLPSDVPVNTSSGIRQQTIYYNGYGKLAQFSHIRNEFVPYLFSFPNDPVATWQLYQGENTKALVPTRPALLHLLDILFRSQGEQNVRRKYNVPSRLVVPKNSGISNVIVGQISDTEFAKMHLLGKRKQGRWNCTAYETVEGPGNGGLLSRRYERWLFENTRIPLFIKFTQTRMVNRGQFAGKKHTNGSTTVAEKLELNPRLTKADFALPPGTRFIAPPIFREIKNHIHPIQFEETEYDKILFHVSS